jgi:hypothetical protein
MSKTRLSRDVLQHQYRWTCSKIRNNLHAAKLELTRNAQDLTVSKVLCTPEVVRVLGYWGVTVTTDELRNYGQCVGMRRAPAEGPVCRVYDTRTVRICTL